MQIFPKFAGTVAILLAAGTSRRMGLPKPLLLVNGTPLVENIVTILLAGGVEQVIAVTSQQLVTSLPELPAHVVVNPEPEAGMLSSVQTGLLATKNRVCHAVLVCPCDLPLLTSDAVYAILHCWNTQMSSDPTAIIVPTFNRKRGHPTLFASGLSGEILALDSQQVGLNELLKHHQEWVHEVAVADSGVVCDADTPDTWEKLMGMPPVCWCKKE